MKLNKVLVAFCLLLISSAFLSVNAQETERKSTLDFWKQIPLENLRTVFDKSYNAYFKDGTKENIMIYFGGGGVAWGAHSAFHPYKKGASESYYAHEFNEVDKWILKMGVMSNHSKNPFKDWTMFFLPYTTADLHTGSKVTTYEKDGKQTTLHYNGKTNTQQILDWIFKNYPNAKKVLVTGSSAGGFGSTFWAGHVAANYNNSRIYALNDAGYIKSDVLRTVADTDWGAEWEKTFGYKPSSDLVGAAHKYYDEHFSNITCLLFITTEDKTLAFYNAKIKNLSLNDNTHLTAWSQDMLCSVSEVTRKTDNYYYYITDYKKTNKGTFHTILGNNYFMFRAEEDGVAFIDWLKNCVIDDEKYSVGEKYLK